MGPDPPGLGKQQVKSAGGSCGAGTELAQGLLRSAVVVLRPGRLLLAPAETLDRLGVTGQFVIEHVVELDFPTLADMLTAAVLKDVHQVTDRLRCLARPTGLVVGHVPPHR
jgi:hypothetical protein